MIKSSLSGSYWRTEHFQFIIGGPFRLCKLGELKKKGADCKLVILRKYKSNKLLVEVISLETGK